VVLHRQSIPLLSRLQECLVASSTSSHMRREDEVRASDHRQQASLSTAEQDGLQAFIRLGKDFRCLHISACLPKTWPAYHEISGEGGLPERVYPYAHGHAGGHRLLHGRGVDLG
jgi:hypothetical protein